MSEKLPEIQIHSSAKINEKLNEVIDWINDVSALRVTDNQVTANMPNIDAGELAFLSKENSDLKDEIDRLETELERTRKALDDAKKWLMKIGYLNMSDHGLGSEKMMTDWCKTVALHGLKEIETALEQKDK